MKQITVFDKEYSFLSNFYPCSVTYKGITFSNSEAAFQAQKCKNVTDKKLFSTLQPGAAKKFGRRVDIVNNWDDIRVEEMYHIVLAKFEQNPELGEKLIKTGNSILIEGNYWHDKFWGVCPETGTVGIDGENHLGSILMEVRKILKEEKYNEI